MYYIYILYSKDDKKLYIGFTNDLKRRIGEHISGQVKSTKHRRPLDLIYYEAYKNRRDAMSREKYFKSGWGRNYIKRILHNCLKGYNKR